MVFRFAFYPLALFALRDSPFPLFALSPISVQPIVLQCVSVNSTDLTEGTHA